MNNHKQHIKEIESCYYDLLFHLYKELNIFKLENQQTDIQKTKDYINKLIKRIKYLLMKKKSNYKFPIPMDNEDLLLKIYQYLNENLNKIKLKIKNLQNPSEVNSFMTKMIKNHFSNLLRDLTRNELEFIDNQKLISKQPKEKTLTSILEILVSQKEPDLFYNKTIKSPADYCKKIDDFEFLKNISNRELTKNELKIFQTMYYLKDTFETSQTLIPLLKEDVAKKLNLTKYSVSTIKSKIFRKLINAKAKRRLVHLLRTNHFNDNYFLKKLKCYELQENMIPNEKYPPQTYYIENENVIYYRKKDYKTLFKLIDLKDNQFEFTQLYYDEIKCIEEEKKDNYNKNTS